MCVPPVMYPQLPAGLCGWPSEVTALYEGGPGGIQGQAQIIAVKWKWLVDYFNFSVLGRKEGGVWSGGVQ